MSNSIELKQLAPYLPYGLKVKIDDDNGEHELIGIVNTDCYIKSKHNKNWLCDIEDFKPLLRPLSDLNKQAPKTVSGIRNIDQINSKASYDLKHKDGETFFWDLPEEMSIGWAWETYEELFANHYDVFDLIDAGLAVDKNTFKPLT